MSTDEPLPVREVHEFSLQIGLIKDLAVVEDKKSSKFHALFSTQVGIFSSIISIDAPYRSDFQKSLHNTKAELSPEKLSSPSEQKDESVKMLSPSVIFSSNIQSTPNIISMKELEKKQKISEIKETPKEIPLLNDEIVSKRLSTNIINKINEKVQTRVDNVLKQATDTIKEQFKNSNAEQKATTEFEKCVKENLGKVKELINEKVEGAINSESFEELLNAMGKKLKGHIESTIKQDMVSIFESIAKQMMIELSNNMSGYIKEIKQTIDGEISRISLAQQSCSKAVEVNLKICNQLEKLRKLQAVHNTK